METKRILKIIEALADKEESKYQERLDDEKAYAPEYYLSDLKGFIRGIYHLRHKLLEAFRDALIE